MNAQETRATLTIGALFSFRMLGLFMILPVFSPFAAQLPDATPFRIGLALGSYGLAQALLQLPFGACSDRYGRKPLIALGFLLFIVGSLVAALSHTLGGIIAGRALQGAGAVGSTLIALLSDLTRSEQRSKAMATIGILIGSAFFLAILLAPLLNSWIGIRGIFVLTAILGVAAIVLLYSSVPTIPATNISVVVTNAPAEKMPYRALRYYPVLWTLDFGIFILHAILTAIFVVLPLQLQQLLPNPAADWRIYVPSMGIAIIFTFAFIGWAEAKKRVPALYRSAIAGLALSLWALGHFHLALFPVITSLTLFFLAFNLLEANLPSLVSRLAPPALKGTAIGLYSTCQYGGIFVGGLLGGWLYGHTSPAMVFIVCTVGALLWWLVALLTPLRLTAGKSDTG